MKKALSPYGLSRLWQTIQSTEGYRDNTVLFIAVDHGQGAESLSGWQHHAEQHGSLEPSTESSSVLPENPILGGSATWMAAIGPGIRDQGLIVTGDQCLTNNRIAATLLQVLGENYRDMNHEMGQPMQAFLQ